MRENYLDPNLSQINPSDKIRSSFYKIQFNTAYFNLLQYVGFIYVISDFRRGVRSSLFWDVTHRRVVVNYRRFGTTYRSHLQGSSNSDVRKQHCGHPCDLSYFKSRRNIESDYWNIFGLSTFVLWFLTSEYGPWMLVPATSDLPRGMIGLFSAKRNNGVGTALSLGKASPLCCVI
jgi:hypothetical protein